MSLSLADAIRRRFPPERIVDLIERLTTSADDERVRMQALQLAADRGYGKVLTTVELTQRQPEARVDWSAVSTERKLELLAAAEEIETIAKAIDVDESVEH